MNIENFSKGQIIFLNQMFDPFETSVHKKRRERDTNIHVIRYTVNVYGVYAVITYNTKFLMRLNWTTDSAKSEGAVTRFWQQTMSDISQFGNNLLWSFV